MLNVLAAPGKGPEDAEPCRDKECGLTPQPSSTLSITALLWPDFTSGSPCMRIHNEPRLGKHSSTEAHRAPSVQRASKPKKKVYTVV